MNSGLSFPLVGAKLQSRSGSQVMRRYVSICAALLVVVAGCSSDHRISARHGLVGLAEKGGSPQALPITSPLPRAAGHTFAIAPDRGDLVAYSKQSQPRVQGVETWHRIELSEAHALQAIGRELAVTAPSGEVLKFAYERHVEHPTGDWTWIGRTKDPSGHGHEAMITFGAKAAFGMIGRSAGPTLRLTVRNGVSWLVDTDARALDALEGKQPREPDYLIPPAVSPRPLQGRATARSLPATNEAGKSVVDLLLGYTTGLSNEFGGESQAITYLYSLVDLTNQAFINSQVNAEIRLVGAVQVAYPDNTSNETALLELTAVSEPAPASLQTLRTARETFGADLVSLVRLQTAESASQGIGWLLGDGQRGISVSEESFGYSVVSGVGNTLAHELGHNLGSHHDRVTATKNGVLEYGAYSYSFGYRTGSDAGNIKTIMAYSQTGSIHYLVFSNPRINFCGGRPCGVDDNADNARSLNQTIPIVSTFRPPAAPSVARPEANPARRETGDIDGDGKSDLLLTNLTFDQTAYWIMSGAVPMRYSPAFTNPPGYARVASGDFNADQKLDLVWARSSDRHLVMWQGDGIGFTQLPIGNYSANWKVVDAGDMDADGKSDLVLQNAVSKLTAYWMMSGSSVVQYSPAFSNPAGFTYLVSADLNGDKRLDIIWGSGRNLRMWLGNAAGSFDIYGVSSLAQGWQVVDAGDIDADGRTDLVVQNAASGLSAYWIMNGSSAPVRYSPTFADPSGYTRVASGDLNGDKRLDVVWASGADRHLLLWQGDGYGFAQTSVGNHATGWQVGVSGQSSTTAKVRGDVDGDNKSDLFLQNASSGLSAYWIMNGASAVRYSPAFTQPAGYTRVATGDFNADRKIDVVWARTSDRHLLQWQGDGSGFSQLPLGNYSAGWQVTGARDIDGDGKSDLLLDNAGQGLVAFWIMNGAVPTRYSVAFVYPVGYARVAIGDFNGDKRSDLVWVRNSDRHLLLWQGDGTGFTPVSIRNHASGWGVVEAGDIDGDGKSDLLLTNSAQGLFAHWLMNGATPIRYSGVLNLPLGYELTTSGDYNGDTRLDLVWVRSTDRSVLMWQGQVDGFNPLPIGTHTDGWTVTDP